MGLDVVVGVVSVNIVMVIISTSHSAASIMTYEQVLGNVCPIAAAHRRPTLRGKRIRVYHTGGGGGGGGSGGGGVGVGGGC